MFGQKLKELRLNKGLTQGEVARKTGLTINIVSILERDVRPPRYNEVIKLANLFDVSISYFFDGKVEEYIKKEQYNELKKKYIKKLLKEALDSI